MFISTINKLSKFSGHELQIFAFHVHRIQDASKKKEMFCD